MERRRLIDRWYFSALSGIIMKQLTTILLIIALCAVQEASAESSWKKIPMTGANVYELTSDLEHSVWAATGSGLFRSDDNGHTWVKQFHSSSGLEQFADVSVTYNR